MEELKEKNLKEKVEELYKEKENKETKKGKRKFRLPRKGKVGRRKMKRGYLTIMRIDDNKNVAFEKQKIQDSTYRLSTRDYHVTNEDDILIYKNKPLLIQATKKLNPYSPLNGKNETYGQPYIMARMLGDTIKVKAEANKKVIFWIIGIVIAGFAVYYFMNSGGI